jgi:two-component system phosphate regulon sensor histidine kinase PhoR
MRLIWQLYPSFLAVTLVAVAAVTLYFSHAFRTFYHRQARYELRAMAEVASPQVVQTLAAGPGEIDALCKRLGQTASGQMRFTVLTAGGRVLGDSHEDPTLMADHSDRREVLAALREGFGEAIRFSPTLGKKMLYVAIPLRENGALEAVIRVALPANALGEVIADMRAHILAAGAVIVVCVALLSLLISRGISRPIVSMRRVARLFAQGQLNIRVPAARAIELDDLAGALNEMATQLGDRIVTITRQRNELEAILSSMTEGVFAIDAGGRIVSINKAAARSLDMDPNAAVGRTVEEMVRNVDLQQFVRETLMSDKPAEADLSFPAGDERFFHVQGAPLLDPRGERAGAVVVLSDMTRIHRLEDLRRDFVANVSHELKTPVTSIQGFAEALQEGGATDPEQTRRYVSIIARHSQRLNAIIDDLLSLSRLEDADERRTLSFESHRLKDVLAGAIELCAARMEQKQVRVTLACDDGIEALVNAPLLEQAVVNLVDNAIKYSGPGSAIEVHVARDPHETRIAVRDTGCGIPSEHLPRIFERFYVVDKSRSRKLGGTGLGLAIVKHIAQVHGGYVTVESTPGRGSTFTIRLPGE